MMWTSTTIETFLQSMQGPMFFGIFGSCNMLCYSEISCQTLYATCSREINIYLNSECVTIDKICVTSYMFLCSKLYALPQCESVTRVKKKCYIDTYCNTW